MKRLMAPMVVATSLVALGVALPATSATAANCSAGYVALTYDDGPNVSSTQALLTALRSSDATATFFIWGQHAQSSPTLLKNIAAAGMQLGNHSWTHPHMGSMAEASIRSELTQTQNVIVSTTGQTPTVFRPPYGESSATLKSVEASLGLKEIIWDVDSGDWNGATADQIVAKAATLQAGQVMLMHDTYQTTISAVPRIVAGLAARSLCAGHISPTTGRAVAPSVAQTPTATTTPATTTPATTTPATTTPATTSPATTPARDCSGGYVALTYDDGPTTTSTTPLLAALKAADATATFFIWGERAQANQQLLKDVAAAGMQVANHSYTHQHMTSLDEATMRSELTRTQDVITSVTGQRPTLFRPPYGETNAALKAVESGLGLTEIIWDLDSADWNSATADQIVAKAATLTAGQVMLMHDTYQSTIDAAPRIVKDLAARKLCTGHISPVTGRAVAPSVPRTPAPVPTPTVTVPTPSTVISFGTITSETPAPQPLTVL